jgi:hypothetical protein
MKTYFMCISPRPTFLKYLLYFKHILQEDILHASHHKHILQEDILCASHEDQSSWNTFPILNTFHMKTHDNFHVRMIDYIIIA